MHNFTSKNLENLTTLGEQLAFQRQSLGLSLKDCAKTLQIQSKYLANLEDSDYHRLPGEIYTRHWLRAYALLLKLDPELCWRRYLQEKGVKLKLQPNAATAYGQRSSQVKQNWLTPKVWRLLGIGLVLLILLAYIGVAIFQTFEAPTVVFDQPLDNFRTQDSNLKVSGQTAIGAEVWFNDQPITVNELGQFSQTVPLVDGLNILTIRAKKKHSREFSQTIQIVKAELPDLLD